MTQLGMLLDFGGVVTTDDDSWCTPLVITGVLPEVDLDPCSNERSTVRARRSIALPDDGLARPWRGSVYCNPPYSKVRPWVEHAVECAAAGGAVLMLIKLDTTTEWWSRAVLAGAVDHPFRKRIPFQLGNSRTQVANFPSAFLEYGDRGVFAPALQALRDAGWIW